VGSDNIITQKKFTSVCSYEKKKQNCVLLHVVKCMSKQERKLLEKCAEKWVRNVSEISAEKVFQNIANFLCSIFWFNPHCLQNQLNYDFQITFSSALALTRVPLKILRKASPRVTTDITAIGRISDALVLK